MSEWRTYRMREVAEIFDGPHATPKKTISGPWFLSIASLKGGRIELNDSAHLSEEDFTRWTRRVIPRDGDVLFSYETRIGSAALMPGNIRACLGRRMALMRPRLDVVDPRFLLFAYLGNEFQDVIRRNTIHGATVDRISLTDLSNWPIRLPSLDVQRAVSSILGALDDKIAVNEQIADTYEAILSTSFDELECDVEQDEATRTVAASKLIDFNPAYAKPHGSVVYVDMAALPTSASRIRSYVVRNTGPGSRFSNGDTLLARITPCLENGKTGFVDFLNDGEIGVGSTEFIVMRARAGIAPHFSYCLARSGRFRSHAIANMVGSSGRQRCPTDVLASFPLQIPDQKALKRFDSRARPAFAHMRSLDEENRTLTALRDALLPKLISGELRIKDAERLVTEVV